MTESTRDYRRFERARQQIADARETARRREQEARLHPPLFDLPEIEEGDR